MLTFTLLCPLRDATRYYAYVMPLMLKRGDVAPPDVLMRVIDYRRARCCLRRRPYARYASFYYATRADTP